MSSLRSSGLGPVKPGLVITILSTAVLSFAWAGTASAQTLTTLASFNGTNGSNPQAGLVADASGNLFGTTTAGGATGNGTVFEIVKTSSGYAGTPTTLVSFNGANGSSPYASLVIDTNGNLFGTTFGGGAYNSGTVFEVVKTISGYASTPTTLVSFDVANGAELLGSLDINGNLFGTSSAGGLGFGTVFEIAKTSSGYASTPTTLVNFNGANGNEPAAGLLIDASGNLFGTTFFGGPFGDGTVFEVLNTGSGYMSTPITLASFNGANGSNPWGGLIMDASGDLFGTACYGGAFGNYGTVFEIVKTSSGYATSPTILVNFNGANGAFPRGNLIADRNGNLFGAAEFGGGSIAGVVFEIAKTASGYASTPTTIASFSGANGNGPVGGLIADANGNLFGTTVNGGAFDDGTVFEVTGSGFVPLFIPFASFQPSLAITTMKPYGYAVAATFTTSAANTAINPVTQAVTLAIASYDVTIPAAAFKAIGKAYLYQGTINGVATYALLTPLGGNQYAFAAAGGQVNLSGTTNPVTVSLTIGSNIGTSQVKAVRVP